MKIATRTALMYALITAGILFVFAYVLYFVSEKNRNDEFNDRLGYKIIWRAEFIFDAHIDGNKIKKLHERNKKMLNEADISVYNSKKQLIFTDIKPSSKNPYYLGRLIKTRKDKITWQRGNRQYMAFRYEFDGDNFYIIGSAVDVTGLAHIKEFRDDIIVVYIISVLIVFIIGFLFSYYTLKPLKDIIVQIRDISEHNLHKRLVVPKAKDEIYELTETFNSTFNRLEKSFSNHRQFVTTISHEFRTPLSTLIAELELAKELNVTLDDYKISINNALQDATHASQLSSALLDFARASYDASRSALPMSGWMKSWPMPKWICFRRTGITGSAFTIWIIWRIRTKAITISTETLTCCRWLFSILWKMPVNIRLTEAAGWKLKFTDRPWKLDLSTMVPGLMKRTGIKFSTFFTAESINIMKKETGSGYRSSKELLKCIMASFY